MRPWPWTMAQKSSPPEHRSVPAGPYGSAAERQPRSLHFRSLRFITFHWITSFIQWAPSGRSQRWTASGGLSPVRRPSPANTQAVNNTPPGKRQLRRATRPSFWSRHVVAARPANRIITFSNRESRQKWPTHPETASSGRGRGRRAAFAAPAAACAVYFGPATNSP